MRLLLRGDYVKTLRFNKGITDKQLSTALNISLELYRRFEGEQTYISLDRVKLIASYLKVDVSAITQGADLKPKFDNLQFDVATVEGVESLLKLKEKSVSDYSAIVCLINTILRCKE